MMTIETLLEKRNTEIEWRVGSHVLFWLIFYGAFVYYLVISFNPYQGTAYVYLSPINMMVSLSVVFYGLVYWVFPKYISKKRWLLSVLTFLLLAVVFTSLIYAGEMLIFNYCPLCKDAIIISNAEYFEYLEKGYGKVMLSRLLSLGILFQLTIILTIPLTVKVGLGYYQSYIKNLQLAQDNVQLELNFLKAQVNPHFLFNTLNNLYGLIIQERTEESAQTVSRLSDFMRYTLHDSSERQVPLEKELDLISNYIELEQLRLNEVKVRVNIENDDSIESIPPLLFLPLIENAFKYVEDQGSNNFIELDLTAHKGQLECRIRNTFDPEQKSNEQGGLGLTNLEKRLNLLFPESHEYGFEINDQTYIAHLKIQCS